MDARQYASLPDPFPMWRGGVLHGARIAYETWGRLNAARDNALLLFTGLSPPAHAASSPADPSDGWWQGMVGPGLAIDTERFFVICVNSLGSCFGSSGPASIDAATGTPYRLTFPDLSVEDIARAGFETVRSLGIERLATVMGPSLGGMVVLAYAAQFPGAARRLVCISGTAAAAPFAIALRSMQREAITDDPDWRGGNYSPHRAPAVRGPAPGAQARHGDLPLGCGMAAALRTRADPRRHEARRSVRVRVRGAGLPGGSGAALRQRLRRQLLPVHLARHGPLRSQRARRAGERVAARRLEHRARDRRADGHAVLRERAAGRRERARGRRRRHALRAAPMHRGARRISGRHRDLRARNRRFSARRMRRSRTSPWGGCVRYVMLAGQARVVAKKVVAK